MVQKHAARRLHYDLRLELDDVLKSWAVTRGPSLTVGLKRLAVRTEDHPIEYLAFEGNIPKGEYGGGSMIVWDRGTWQPIDDPHKGLAKGHLAFRLVGDRLKGAWHLVRINPRTGERTEPWLLIKSEDAFARPGGAPEITDEIATSQLSGRTNDELAADGEIRKDHKARAAVRRRAVLPDIAKIKGARRGLLPSFLEPSLACPCEKPPSGPQWIHEIKHDGYRIQARIDGGAIKLLTRKALDWTDRFGRIAAALKAVGLGSALFDGEIIVEDAAGISSFNNLQDDLKTGRPDRFRYLVFDLLYCEGFDLTKAALADRKGLLDQAVAGLPEDTPIRFSEHLETDGPTMLEHSCRLGLEGIVSKRRDLPYRPGRGQHWFKAKCRHSQEFIILGFIASTAASRSVGSLLLGHYADGTLVYAGRVGTGWSLDTAKSLYAALAQLTSGKPALAKPMPAGTEKGVTWAEPRLVCAIEFRDWTQEGLVRQSSFKGLIEDRSAEDVTLEVAPNRARCPVTSDLAGIKLTHPDRILWPASGITKQGLAEFYAGIAEWILPHISGRPLSLLRCPSGANEKCFFAKHPWAGLDPAAELVDVGEEEPMFAIRDMAGLLTLIQAGVVEIHPWGSRVGELEHPDRLIFDLDPGEEVAWGTVTEAAGEVRKVLLGLGLKSFVKTSGGKGLHIVLPLEPRLGWEEAKAFTAAVATTMARRRPERYVTTMSKRARRGQIFIDFLRNDRGSTAVGAYSTRALPQASVSTPLEWEELSDAIRADHFTVANLRHRLDHLRRDPWRDISKLRQRIPADAEKRLKSA